MNLRLCNYHYHLSVSAGIVHIKFCPVFQLFNISKTLQIIRLHCRNEACTCLILHQIKHLKGWIFYCILTFIWHLTSSLLPPENMLMYKWILWPIKSVCHHWCLQNSWIGRDLDLTEQICAFDYGCRESLPWKACCRILGGCCHGNSISEYEGKAEVLSSPPFCCHRCAGGVFDGVHHLGSSEEVLWNSTSMMTKTSISVFI